jgi:hypothetical protein
MLSCFLIIDVFKVMTVGLQYHYIKSHVFSGSRAIRFSCLAFVNSGTTVQWASFGRRCPLAVIAKCFGKLPLLSLPGAAL